MCVCVCVYVYMCKILRVCVHDHETEYSSAVYLPDHQQSQSLTYV